VWWLGYVIPPSKETLWDNDYTATLAAIKGDRAPKTSNKFFFHTTKAAAANKHKSFSGSAELVYSRLTQRPSGIPPGRFHRKILDYALFQNLLSIFSTYELYWEYSLEVAILIPQHNHHRRIMSTNHYILHIDPQARYNWEHYRLEHPLTGMICDPSEEIAQALGNLPGRYLVAIRWEVKILECLPVKTLAAPPATAPLTPIPQLPARLAS